MTASLTTHYCKCGEPLRFASSTCPHCGRQTVRYYGRPPSYSTAWILCLSAAAVAIVAWVMSSLVT